LTCIIYIICDTCVYIKNTSLHNFPPTQMHDEAWIKMYFF